ncbi:MAG: L,D-transpeptidase family protein [Rhodothermales bacterium]|nr:L,D-transpeptidase family protein [Rhodothermales bacterium]
MGKLFQILTILFVLSTTASAQLQDHSQETEPAAIRSFGGVVETRESANPDNLPVVYPVEERLTVFSEMDEDFPYVEVAMREPVFVLASDDNWLHVRTKGGATGYVLSGSVSDFWIRVSKKERTVRIYRGDDLHRTLPADLAINFFSNKVRKGGQENVDHWRTPEGVFYVVNKNPESQFHRAFVLNYPGVAEAERGLRHGMISRDEYNQIVRADDRFEMPPMFTKLGGFIEIHGDGTGARTNWTRGCIALRNDDIDELWDVIKVGTPVLIEK